MCLHVFIRRGGFGYQCPRDIFTFLFANASKSRHHDDLNPLRTFINLVMTHFSKFFGYLCDCVILLIMDTDTVKKYHTAVPLPGHSRVKRKTTQVSDSRSKVYMDDFPLWESVPVLLAMTTVVTRPIRVMWPRGTAPIASKELIFVCISHTRKTRIGVEKSLLERLGHL